jgi:hypothetical protein
MKILRYLGATALLLLMAVAAQAAPSENLDELYGTKQKPNYVKYYEVSPKGVFWIHPYLQVATDDNHGILDPAQAPYNFMIDGDGNVRINIESRNPWGRKYDYEWFRPEDFSKRKKGSSEKDGHVTTMGGQDGRIGGEFLWEEKTGSWTINNKSGRYSNANPDRTPEQLMNAVARVQQVVDIPGAKWGEVRYLFRYSPKALREEFMKKYEISFARPEKEDFIQKDPYILLRK